MKGAIVFLGGDTGSFRLRVFGREGGISAPVIENDIVQPVEVKKTQRGVQKIYVPLDVGTVLQDEQFFVCIERVTDRIYLLTDKKHKIPACTTPQHDQYFFQMIKEENREWTHSTYSFAIEPVVQFVHFTHPIFVKDTNFIVSEKPQVQEIVTSPPVTNNYSIACLDMDNDGFVDIINNGRLYHNENGRYLREITKAAGLYKYPKASAVMDINNDGLQDVLFFGYSDSTDSNVDLFLNRNGRSYTPAKLGSLPAIKNPTSYSIADLNSDGYADIVITQQVESGTTLQPLMIFINNRHNGFVERSSALPFAHDLLSSGTCVTLVDVDGDGRCDIYLSGVKSHANKSISCILFARGEKFTEYDNKFAAQVTDSVSDDRVFRGASWFDIDNDGIIDLLSSQRVSYQLFRENPTKQSALLLNSGLPDTLFRNYATLPYTSKHSSGICGDFDNDGLVDCILTTDCECSYADALVQKAPAQFIRSNFELGLSGLSNNKDAVLVDLNNDGRLDVVIVQNGTLQVYRNQCQSAGSFVTIKPVADHYTSSTTTKVSVYVGGNRFVRDVIAGRGLLMQDPEMLTFGLGDSRYVDSVHIQWPDGKKESFYNVNINQVVSLKENEGQVYGTSNMTAAKLSVQPNPFTNGLKISYSLHHAARVTLSIYELDGKLFRELITDQVFDSGTFNAEWDGRSFNGQVAGVGSYIIRLRSNSDECVAKVTKID